MIKRIALLFLLIYSVLTEKAIGQVQYDSILVQLLLSDSSAYQRSYCSTPLIWDNTARQVGNAIKQGKTIYYLPDQYGAVFTAEKRGDSIKVERIDKTHFSGHNGGHYCFIYNGEIYSFGGYGTWRTNGQLRKFLRDKGEWDLVKLDRELPSYNEFTYYDSRDHMLWCGEQDYVNEVLPTDKFRTEHGMYSLGMKKLSWEKRGAFNINQTHRDHPAEILCETSTGALIFTAGPSFEILDFRSNKRYLLNDISDSLLALAKPTVENLYNYFFINGHIVVYDLKKQQIISQIKLDGNQLTTAKTPVHESPPFAGRWPVMLLTGSIGLILIMFLYRKSRKRARLKTPIFENGSNGTPVASFQKSLSLIENEVLEKIKTDTIAGKRTTTNCLNKILGTDKKSPETQKAQRSKTLSAINDKYKLYHKKDMKLINIMRMEEDKRLVEYYIDPQSVQSLAE